MTIKLKEAAPPPPPPPVGEGQAQVYVIELPSVLDAGVPITGKIKIQNIGAGEDDLRGLITTMWNGKQFSGGGRVPVGSILTLTISEGLMTMPAEDAVIKIEAQHDANGTWVTDDTKSH